MPDIDVSAAAETLFAMRRDQQVVEDLPPGQRPAELAESYAIQAELVDRLLAARGGRRIGYKVACTNAIAQQALQIDRPVFGTLLSATTFESPATIAAAGFTHRVIEAEFGVDMAATVPPSEVPYTAETIAPFVASVFPSIEVVDHRFVDWSVGARSVAADNAIHGCWVTAPAAVDWRTLDLAGHEVRVDVDGELRSTGTGAAVLGHPLEVVAFLANELPTFGRQLLAGDRITTGVCTDVFEADAGSTVVADFGALGSVTIHWS